MLWKACSGHKVLHDFLYQEHMINAARFCQTLERLKSAIRQKCPGLLSAGVILLDNTHPHSAHKQVQITQLGWERLPPILVQPWFSTERFSSFSNIEEWVVRSAFSNQCGGRGYREMRVQRARSGIFHRAFRLIGAMLGQMCEHLWWLCREVVVGCTYPVICSFHVYVTR